MVQGRLPYRLYIFDFDGTLADTCGAVVATYNATLRMLELPEQPAAHIVNLMGLPLGTTFERVGVPDAMVDGAVKEYRRLFPTTGTPLVSPFEGVPETLARLRERGATLTVASSRGRDSLRNLLELLGLANHFVLALGEEDVTQKKPEPEAVLRILEARGAAPEEALVVGDTVYDLQMGRAAGCATCGVTYGSHPAEELRPLVSRPEYLLGRFDALLEL
jgi:phosphoglycolate phosphatase